MFLLSTTPRVTYITDKLGQRIGVEHHTDEAIIIHAEPGDPEFIGRFKVHRYNSPITVLGLPTTLDPRYSGIIVSYSVATAMRTLGLKVGYPVFTVEPRFLVVHPDLFDVGDLPPECE
jgi:hypothetical protein